MRKRIDYNQVAPAGTKALGGLFGCILQSTLPRVLVELVYLLVSQIDNCAFCLDMHTRGLIKKGQKIEKLARVQAWVEAGNLFDGRRRAALARAEIVIRVAETGVPDNAYVAARSVFDGRELVDLAIAISQMNAYTAWRSVSETCRKQYARSNPARRGIAIHRANQVSQPEYLYEYIHCRRDWCRWIAVDACTTHAGSRVTGMTWPSPGVDRHRELGAAVSKADAFDAQGVSEAIESAEPDVVIDQLTWLPANPADIIKAMPNDTRLHREGGRNLLAAAEAMGVSRFIMQSRGFYLDAPHGKLADENARLKTEAPGAIGDSARTFSEYESRVLGSPTIAGVVLRHGFFCGPGTWYRPDGAVADQVRNGQATTIGEGSAVWSFGQIEEAVAATVASLTAASLDYALVYRQVKTRTDQSNSDQVGVRKSRASG